MKLIYCTSLVPSGKANRLQTFAMSKILAKYLKNNFYLGVAEIGDDYAAQNLKYVQIINLKIIKSYFLAWKYLKFIKKNNIQYIYCREPRLLFFLILYSKIFLIFKLKFIYEIHEIAKRNWIDKLINNLLVHQIDYFIFVTRNLQDLYIKKYQYSKIKTLIAPDGVDLGIFDLNLTIEEARKKFDLPLDKKIIGFFGRFKTLGMDKGLKTIFEALKLLSENIVLLAMGGKPKDIEFYSQLAKDLGVRDKIIFVEHLNQKEVALRQKACDILLMPFPYTEHFAYYMSPLKMFEYMASGRPIIASDLPSVKEILNESNAFFVEPDNPNDLVKVIKKSLNNQELANKISAKAYLDIQKYTWEKRTEKTLDFIKGDRD